MDAVAPDRNGPLPGGRVPADAGLPARAGIGFKPQHHAALLADDAPPAFVEVHAENYMGQGGTPHAMLASVRARMPLSVHGVGLSIGGSAPPDAAHLQRLSDLLARYEPAAFSEHLAWSSHGGVFFNDLLPLCYDPATLDRVCDHVDLVQARLGRRLLLENPSTYVAFEASTIDEPDFLAAVVRRTGCGLLLDVNNVHVSCFNHRRDPFAYLARLPMEAVGELHLAGHAEDAGADAPLLIDDHGAAVAADVWSLYRHVLARTGPLPTLIEWDSDVPAYARLRAEATLADTYLSQPLHEACAA